jgi:mono/diheme cytochrome c family protein
MKFNILISIGALLLAGSAAFCADGAAMYKTKCAVCHGADGQGKPAIKAPSLKETKLDVNQIVAHLMKGEPASKPPHNHGIPGLKEDDAKAIAEYVKTLK